MQQKQQFLNHKINNENLKIFTSENKQRSGCECKKKQKNTSEEYKASNDFIINYNYNFFSPPILTGGI